jgi:hypothetical protein
MPLIVSTLTPTPATLLSDAILHLRRIDWLLADAGSITVVVMYPPELPDHAIRPAIGDMNAVEIVALYPPEVNDPPAARMS